MNRADRIANELHALIAQMIQREIKDPRVGEISITRVEVSGDLGVAKIYFLPLGGQGDPQKALVGLIKASGFIRRKLRSQMRLRSIPELRFTIDHHHDAAVSLIEELNAIAALAVADRGEE
jgi:ribosome-binding factor A